MIKPFRGASPDLAPDAVILEGALLIGAVRCGSGCSFWYNTVLRADLQAITMGADCNIQDLACLHVSSKAPLVLGDRVTVGHGAVLHACTFGSDVLVGIKAVVLDGAVIGDFCIVAPGAVVAPGSIIPSGSLVKGVPARVDRPLRDDEREYIRSLAARYRDLAREHQNS